MGGKELGLNWCWDSVPPFLVVGVEAGRVGGLPEHEEGRLVTKPHDEPTRRVRRRREVGRNIGLKIK